MGPPTQRWKKFLLTEAAARDGAYCLDGSPGGGVSVTARWTVSGSVNHFGHTHYRRNRYAARVDLLPVDGIWKIGGIEVLEEEREL